MRRLLCFVVTLIVNPITGSLENLPSSFKKDKFLKSPWSEWGIH